LSLVTYGATSALTIYFIVK